MENVFSTFSALPWTTNARLCVRLEGCDQIAPNDGHFVVKNADGSSIVIIPVLVGDGMDIEEDRAERRALLIAAALDLLEACYSALELRCPDGDEHECGTLAVISDAIAKATRETD